MSRRIFSKQKFTNWNREKDRYCRLLWKAKIQHDRGTINSVREKTRLVYHRYIQFYKIIIQFHTYIRKSRYGLPIKCLSNSGFIETQGNRNKHRYFQYFHKKCLEKSVCCIHTIPGALNIFKKNYFGYCRCNEPFFSRPIYKLIVHACQKYICLFHIKVLVICWQQHRDNYGHVL